MRPSRAASAAYLRAFAEIVRRIERAIGKSGKGKRAGPVRMYVAGGAAMHLYTGARISADIDASLSHRVLLPDDLEVAYRDVDGSARLLYFDRQYNDTFGLMHEKAYDDSMKLELDSVDSRMIEVRLLSPLDLAVSKLSRFAEHDREDIGALADLGLIDAAALKKRAAEALVGYVGDPKRVERSTRLACSLVRERTAGK